MQCDEDCGAGGDLPPECKKPYACVGGIYSDILQARCQSGRPRSSAARCRGRPSVDPGRDADKRNTNQLWADKLFRRRGTSLPPPPCNHKAT